MNNENFSTVFYKIFLYIYLLDIIIQCEVLKVLKVSCEYLEN